MQYLIVTYGYLAVFVLMVAVAGLIVAIWVPRDEE
jgi:hypothetical protein